jgi:hypothetical protein
MISNYLLAKQKRRSKDSQNKLAQEPIPEELNERKIVKAKRLTLPHPNPSHSEEETKGKFKLGK